MESVLKELQLDPEEISKTQDQLLLKNSLSIDKYLSFIVTLELSIGLALGYWQALILGLPALFFAWKYPGTRAVRILMGVAQMGFSSLVVIHYGGSLESYFHIFVSLAALSFYKDIGALTVPVLVLLLGQVSRGTFDPDFVPPLSVFLWVGGEYFILCLGILRLRAEVRDMAASQALFQKAREQAMQMASRKSTFLSNMSHEIRNPLNSIIGFSEILKEVELQGEHAGYLKTIHRCSESLLHLINDILDISKIESGLMKVDCHTFDLYEFHEDIHRIYEARCREKGIEFSITVSTDVLRYVKGDSFRLRQVLMNLISNAIKFTDSGKIVIQVYRDPEKKLCCWSVADTGKGISSESIPKLFDEFFQEDPSVARVHGGSGLGLLITKNLVELMGGKISVLSTKGEGSTFSFGLILEESYKDA